MISSLSYQNYLEKTLKVLFNFLEFFKDISRKLCYHEPIGSAVGDVLTGKTAPCMAEAVIVL